ncbi:MAG: MFS transporter [Sedimentisphaerales bacterium]|nr:MFS transporter [Sedimentisphaerales bacterium]
MNIANQKLSFKEKAGYGFGDLASVLYWQTFMAYLLFFYTDVFGISAVAAGTLLLVSRLWDGVNDPMMGMIADRTRTRWGKYRPYLLWLAVPLAVLGVLTFSTPNLNITGKIIYAYVTFTLLMMLYTAINIPYSSILGVITSNPTERTSVSSYKFIFAYISGTIVSVTLLIMVDYVGRDNNSIIQVSNTDSVIQIKEVAQGSAKVKLYATDSAGETTETEFAFRVNPTESNLPLIKNSIPTTNLEQGFLKHEIDLSDVFIINNPEDIKYKISVSNDSVVEAEVENSKIVLKEVGVGSARITLTAEDKKWGSTETRFDVNVNETGNSRPVVAHAVNEYKLKQGFDAFTLNLAAMITDPDNDPLIFVAESDNTKIVSPSVKDSELSFLERKPGLANVKVKASDGKGGIAEYKFKVIITSAENNPPFLSNPISNISRKAGFGSQQIDISDVFIDVDDGPLTYSFQVVNYAKGWRNSFIIYGIAAVLFFMIAFLSVKERVQPPKAQKTSVKKDLVDLFSNKPWVLLLITTLLFILFVATRMSVTAHYFKYYIGEHQVEFINKTYNLGFEELVSGFNAVGQACSILGVLFIAWFAKVVGKRRAFLLFFIIACICTGAYYFLRPDQLFLIFFLQAIGSFTGGPLSPLIWAMYADTADYSEWKTGRRATGLIFSASTMSQKFGWAIGAAVVGALLSYFGFRANEIQSPEVLNGIKALMSIIPVAAGVVAIFIMLFYKLDEKTMKQIEGDLSERRKASDEDTAPA